MNNRIKIYSVLLFSVICHYNYNNVHVHSFSSYYNNKNDRNNRILKYNKALVRLNTIRPTKSSIIVDDDDKSLKDKLSNYFRNEIMLGIEPKPEIIAIMTIYFVEGAISLSYLARTFLLKDTLHLGPSENAALSGLFTLPWTIKPLYGFLSDSVPIFGYRRRSYLILAGIIGCVSYLSLGVLTSLDGPVSDPNIILKGTIATLITSSACIAFSDVVADGIVVQKTRENSSDDDGGDPKLAGGLQSLCWGSAALGGLIASYFSGSLLETMTPSDIFKISSVLPLLVATIALFIDEQPITKDNAVNNHNDDDNNNNDIDNNLVSNQIQALWSAIKLPAVWKPTLFLFLWQATPTSGGAFLYFMTNELKMGPEFLGQIRFITSIASFVGVWTYQKYLRDVPIKDILFWTSLVSAPIGLLQLLVITHTNQILNIPDNAFVLGDDVALTLLGELSFLPILVLAARICPPGVEAVLFATLMSVFNGAGTVGTEFGALLTSKLGVTESNFDNLALLTIICNLSSLIPLLFLGLLDDVGDMTTSQMEDDDDDDYSDDDYEIKNQFELVNGVNDGEEIFVNGNTTLIASSSNSG